jgi:Domain of unknown function (DUF3786)
MAKLKLTPEELTKIRSLTNTANGNDYHFLGYTLNLKTAELQDQLNPNGAVNDIDFYVLDVILSHYALASPAPRTGKFIKFKDLPGGPAYELAFLQRAVQPIAEAFGSDPSALLEAGKRLGGEFLSHGDASAEVPALAKVPIVYILWAADEFLAEASVLFDSSASAYLPTEDLAVLGELTSNRLKKTVQNL